MKHGPDTEWRDDSCGIRSRTCNDRRLVVIDEGDGLWSWQVWGVGDYEPEDDGEASSMYGAMLAAEQRAGGAGLLADYEVSP